MAVKIVSVPVEFPLGLFLYMLRPCDEINLTNRFAVHQSLPCARGGGPLNGGSEGLSIPQSRCSRDSSLYTREPWALPRQLKKLEFDKDVIFIKLENAELTNIERIVAISKAAFDSDIDVGASEPDGPPDYDSISWHIQMKNEGHLLQAVIDGEIVGGAILFLDKDGEILYIGRIFIDPVHYRKGYGLSLMKMVEAYYSGIKKIKLDTPLWNLRTNAFYTKLGYCEVKRDEGFAYYQKELD